MQKFIEDYKVVVEYKGFPVNSWCWAIFDTRHSPGDNRDYLINLGNGFATPETALTAATKNFLELINSLRT